MVPYSEVEENLRPKTSLLSFSVGDNLEFSKKMKIEEN